MTFAGLRLLLLLGGAGMLVAREDVPHLPLQFKARIEVTAHLVDRSQEYPPWLRVLLVDYDFVSKRARAVIERGLEEGKTFTRRYDKQHEYVVRSGEFAGCQRSHLGERMPVPVLPETMRLESRREFIGTVPCEHWVEDAGSSRVHVWLERRAGAYVPRRLTEETVADGESVELMTYDWLDVELLEPGVSTFELDGHTHANCTRHIGGFPYLHILHWYVRF